jgi:hypothetical protein
MITLDSIDYSLHSIQIKDADGDALAISAAGEISAIVSDGGGSITVDGTVELGATTLAALESITVQNGSGASAVNIQDGGNSITVDAINLDIRDLTHVSDSVKIGDGTDFLSINADGSLNVQTVEAGYASWSVVAASVDTTAGGVQLVASPLSNRLRIEIQNLGTQDIYIRQSTGVTTSNGLKIPKGSSYEQALDAGAQIWAITPSGTSDVRIAQYAA